MHPPPRNTLLTLGALAALGFATTAATGRTQHDADEAAIAAVLERSYVDAVFRARDPEQLREGFADTFVMQVYWDGELTTRPLERWLEKMGLDRQPTGADVRGEVTVLDVEGAAAVARLDLYRGSEHEYTDYFGLYRTPDGWRVVTKHFHAHGNEGHERPSGARQGR